MSLLIPDYPDPQGVPGTAIPAAYAWIEHLSLGFSDGTGRLALWVHRSPEAAASWADAGLPNVPPAEALEYPVGGGIIPSLPELMADAEFAAAFAVVRDKLYAALLADPRFAGAQLVP